MTESVTRQVRREIYGAETMRTKGNDRCMLDKSISLRGP